MLRTALKYLPVIASVMLLFIDADRLFRLLFWPFTRIDSLALVPQVLNTEQRFSLFGLWLGGSLYFLALMWVAVTRRNKVYLSLAVALAVFVTGISLFNIPFGEQNQRRWQSMNQLVLPAWKRFLFDQNAVFEYITGRQPFEPQETIARFTQETTPLKKLPLGWNNDDVAATNALWQPALGNRVQEAQALAKMADYLTWMPDYAPLVLASAILTLTTDDDKTRAEAAFRRAIFIAPDNPDAWLGWSLAQIQSHDDPQARYAHSLQFTQRITIGLLMAEELKGRPRQPALAQRLADYIAQMPQDDRQILHILQARINARTCDMPLSEHVRGEADKVLPLRRAITDKNRIYHINRANLNFPGHVVLEAEKYGIVAESLSELFYPSISAYIKSATTRLSLDINASGEVLNTVVECTSGFSEFDDVAMASAARWRFQPASEGRRVLIPVTFISDRPIPEEHFQDMEARAIHIARLAARHNEAAMKTAVKEMDMMFNLMDPFFVQKPVTRQEARALQNISFTRGAHTIEAISKAFDETTQAMENLSRRYPYYVPLLKDLALRKRGRSFEEQRAIWAKMLALTPNDPHVWAGWGSLWSEADPEVYMGALLYSNLLLPRDPDNRQKIEQVKVRLIMRVGMGDRGRILAARANTGYADILGQQGIVDAGKDDAEEAKNIFPASTALNRHEAALPADPQGTMTVEVNQKEIVSAPLSGVPLLETPVRGNKRTELTVDVDKNGNPALVLVSKSSLVEEYDARAVNMLWGWTFRPQPGGRQITVGVNFSR